MATWRAEECRTHRLKIGYGMGLQPSLPSSSALFSSSNLFMVTRMDLGARLCKNGLSLPILPAGNVFFWFSRLMSYWSLMTMGWCWRIGSWMPYVSAEA